MKTVVITGSARGFCLCQAKKFKELGCNVVISDINEANLEKALAELNKIKPDTTKAIKVKADVTSYNDLENLWNIADVVKSIGMIVAASAISFGFWKLGMSESNIIMVYILCWLLICGNILIILNIGIIGMSILGLGLI